MPDAPWVQVAAQQGEQYRKGAEKLLFRRRIILNRLKQAGRISHQKGGYDLRWTVDIREPDVNSVNGFEQIEYAANQPFERFVLPWAQYRSVDAIHRLEEAMVGGPGEIVNRWGGMVKRHTDAHMHNLNKEFFIDGYASGNERALKGLRSCTGSLGSGSTAATDRIAYPSDTYGEQSTVLGTKGGSWSDDLSTNPNNTGILTDWPFGQGSSQYDFNTPVLVKTDSSDWSGSNDTWVLGADEMWRYGVEAVRNLNRGEDLAGELGVMDSLSFAQFKQKMSGIFSVNKPQFTGTEDLGFVGDTLNFEGTTMAPDSDCPVGWRFLIRLSSFELVVLDSRGQKGLFYQSGPVFDQEQDSATFQMGGIMQLKYQPKGMAAFYNFSHA